MITGLSHLTFIVSDLERSALFFEKIFGAREVYASGNEKFSLSKEKFFLINDIWICIMEGEPLAERTYNHIAFQINESDIDNYILRIKDAGAEIKPERTRVAGEGRSIYFYDFDNHLFELHTGTLEGRLACYFSKEESDDKI
jgi:catechol 2,3-dioxygenase-like lactoylglutathione lyase family enzyme